MDLLAAAVSNNAGWCALVTGKGGAAEVSTGAWIAAPHQRLFFPNAVTLRPGVSPDALAAALAACGPCSVKDSYADVDLGPWNFRQLFRADWIAYTASRRPLPSSTTWSALIDSAELPSWCSAAGLPEVLPPGLVGEPSVRILASHRKGRLVGGAIANRSGAVVGISNVFQADGGSERFWDEVTAAVRNSFPGLPIVGYERDRHLAAALTAGFTSLGPLRVWLRDAAP